MEQMIMTCMIMDLSIHKAEQKERDRIVRYGLALINHGYKKAEVKK